MEVVVVVVAEVVVEVVVVCCAGVVVPLRMFYSERSVCESNGIRMLQMF